MNAQNSFVKLFQYLGELGCQYSLGLGMICFILAFTFIFGLSNNQNLAKIEQKRLEQRQAVVSAIVIIELSQSFGRLKPTMTDQEKTDECMRLVDRLTHRLNAVQTNTTVQDILDNYQKKKP